MGLFHLFGSPDFDTLLLHAKENPDAVILDVRTPEEYRQGHVPGAQNVPLDQLQFFSAEKDTPLYVYCQSGARSSRAEAALRAGGYSSVTNLGGIMSYHGSVER